MNSHNLFGRRFLQIKALMYISVLVLLAFGCTSPVSTNASFTPSQAIATPANNSNQTHIHPDPMITFSQTPMPAQIRGTLLFTDLHGIYIYDIPKNTLTTLSNDDTRMYNGVGKYKDSLYFLRTTDKKNDPKWPSGGQFGPFEIFKMQLNGDGLEQLTSGEYTVLHLSIAPNGDYLSFSTDSEKSNNRYQIFLWDLKDHTRKVIAQDQSNSFSTPIWSPNSKELVYFKNTFPSNITNPLIFDLQSGTSIEFAPEGEITSTKLAWSPEGDQITFGMTTKRGSGLYSYDINSKKITLMTSTPQSPENIVWSPDGKMIVYELQKRDAVNNISIELALLELATRKVSIIQEGELDGRYFSYNTVWSPDSKYIAFFTHAGLGELELNLVQVNNLDSYRLQIPGFYADSVVWISPHK